MERRLNLHAEGRGAGRSLRQVVYLEQGLRRSLATHREIQIKVLSRAEKRNLIRLMEAK